MKVRDVLRLLREDGWYLVRVRGSHARYAHPEKKTLVTVPGQGGDELAPKTLRSILRQAGLRYPFRVEDE